MRAITSIRLKFFVYFTLKITFSILHIYLSKTPTSVYLLYTLFSLNNHFIFFFYYFNNLTVKPTFSLFFFEHYSLSLSLSLSRWVFFLFLLSLIFLYQSSFLFLPISSLENSINKPENSINKPKIFTSTQTHVNLSPFGLDMVMAARQMRWQQQQGRSDGRSDWFLLGFSCGFLLDFSYGFSVGFSFYWFWCGFGMGFSIGLGCSGDSWVVLSWWLENCLLLLCWVAVIAGKKRELEWGGESDQR